MDMEDARDDLERLILARRYLWEANVLIRRHVLKWEKAGDPEKVKAAKELREAVYLGALADLARSLERWIGQERHWLYLTVRGDTPPEWE